MEREAGEAPRTWGAERGVRRPGRAGEHRAGGLGRARNPRQGPQPQVFLLHDPPDRQSSSYPARLRPAGPAPRGPGHLRRRRCSGHSSGAPGKAAWVPPNRPRGSGGPRQHPVRSGPAVGPRPRRPPPPPPANRKPPLLPTAAPRSPFLVPLPPRVRETTLPLPPPPPASSGSSSAPLLWPPSGHAHSLQAPPPPYLLPTRGPAFRPRPTDSAPGPSPYPRPLPAWSCPGPAPSPRKPLPA
ncbi:PREDICTED: proline-rich protein 2-like [Chinchilla lanigera]|uniref:proline-rich protein 2-like n=1 Tax=Chinchilla lanigera TaxID=34839 RepID=UPI00069679DB|nr:PREDICTED: proline-rich protein 2-like [Chinchilla lanigera]